MQQEYRSGNKLFINAVSANETILADMWGYLRTHECIDDTDSILTLCECMDDADRPFSVSSKSAENQLNYEEIGRICCLRIRPITLA